MGVRSAISRLLWGSPSRKAMAAGRKAQRKVEAAINFRSQLDRDLFDETDPGLRVEPSGEHVYVMPYEQADRWLKSARCPVCKAGIRTARIAEHHQEVERTMSVGGWWRFDTSGPPVTTWESLPCGCCWEATAPAAAGGPE